MNTLPTLRLAPPHRRRTRLMLLALCLATLPWTLPAHAGMAIGNNPLYLVSGKANVLVVLDNSNSMDEDASGAAVGSNSPNSKSEVARGVVRTLTDNYKNCIHMGLMRYKQNNPSGSYLHNSPYDASYDPATYDPVWAGAKQRHEQALSHRQPDLGRQPHPLQRRVAVLCGQQSGQRLLLFADLGAVLQRREPGHRPVGQLPLLPHQDRHQQHAACVGQCSLGGGTGLRHELLQRRAFADRQRLRPGHPRLRQAADLELRRPHLVAQRFTRARLSRGADQVADRRPGHGDQDQAGLQHPGRPGALHGQRRQERRADADRRHAAHGQGLFRWRLERRQRGLCRQLLPAAHLLRQELRDPAHRRPAVDRQTAVWWRTRPRRWRKPPPPRRR